MKLSQESKRSLIEIYENKGLSIEGGILKILDTSDDEEFDTYIKNAIKKDSESRQKRLEITKTIQKQNNELIKQKNENEKINEELKIALEESRIAKEQALLAKDSAEKARQSAENDFDVLQKKTQYELIGTIVKVSLWMVVGIGITTTALFTYTVISNSSESEIIKNAWSNITGILLTNSFSILGTIMGVKYATERSEKYSPTPTHPIHKNGEICKYCGE